jgi:LPPG:FO 2-phospho-L-lactate transferase
MAELGHEPTVVGVARLYSDFVGTLVIDDADAGSADAVESCGVRCVVTPTVMHTPEHAGALASVLLDAVRGPRATRPAPR